MSRLSAKKKGARNSIERGTSEKVEKRRMIVNTSFQCEVGVDGLESNI